MGRISIEVDDEALAAVMDRYGLATADEAVALALQRLADERMSKAEILAMQGTGWGDGIELEDLYADGGVETI